MGTAFLGTSDFAAAVLQRLAGSRHRPALVVTPPDRRRGRGRRLLAPPAAQLAGELGLELIQPEDVNEAGARERLHAAGIDAAVVCAFGQLIEPPLLDQIEMLNIHPSLLPRWRGAAPIERAIMAGDPETGVTVIRLTEGLDSGPIALQRRVAIDPADDFGSLSPRLAGLAGELIVEVLDRRRAGVLELTDQDDALVTYAEKVDPAERRLDPGRPATELARVVRALTPHIGAHIELAGGDRLGVRAAVPLTEGPAAGELEADGGELRLGCATGALALVEVQPPGRRPMSAEAYLRGNPAPSIAAR